MPKPLHGFLAIGLLMLAALRHLAIRPNEFIQESLSQPKYLLPLLGWGGLTLLCWLWIASYWLFPRLWSMGEAFLARFGKTKGRLLSVGIVLVLLVWILPSLPSVRSLAYYLAPYPLLLVLILWGCIGLASPAEAAKPVGRWLLQGGSGILFALLLLEVLLRLFPLAQNHPVQIQKDLVYLFRQEPEFGWSLRPNYEFTWASEDEFETQVQLNSLGQHDLERSYAPTKGSRRIAVIGDSFVEALQVSLEQTPTQIAETCLNEQSPNQPVEVLNLGISATGTGQQWRFYHYRAAQYQPDEVVLSLYVLNDFNDNQRTRNWIVSLYGAYSFSLTTTGAVQPKYIEPWRGWLEVGADQVRLETFRTLRALKRLYEQDNEQGYTGVPALLLPEFPQNASADWALMQAILHDFKAEVEANGSRFSVLLIPSLLEIEPEQYFDAEAVLDTDAAHRTLLAFLENELQVSVIDLYPVVRQQQPLQPLYFEQDGHFNAAGYQVMGHMLCQALVSE